MPIKKRSQRVGALGSWQRIRLVKTGRRRRTQKPRRLERSAKTALETKRAMAKSSGGVLFDSKKPRAVSHKGKRTEQGITRTFRTVDSTYFDWVSAWDNPVFKEPKYFSYLRGSKAGGRTFQERVPHLIGTGMVIEICEKESGRPDFLMLVRRSPKVSHGAGKIDFPGGIVEAGEHPAENVRREIQEEFLGREKVQVKFVGPGLKIQRNQKDPLAITTVIDEARANPSIMYVMRINMSREEIKKARQSAAERWEAERVIFVPRNARAIKRFMDRNKRQIWYPGILRKYLNELSPGWRKRIKKK